MLILCGENAVLGWNIYLPLGYKGLYVILALGIPTLLHESEHGWALKRKR
jgi:hypothetical protein